MPVTPRYTDALPLVVQPSRQVYEQMAADLVAARTSGDPAAVRAWATALIGRFDPMLRPGNRDIQDIVEEIERSSSDARQIIGALQGFANWEEFAAHLDALADPASAIGRFETTADAIVSGDLATLERQLRADPDLVRARSSRVHHATLLHYTAANGHEGWRQRTPPNAVEIARALLRAGAEPDALADMYGHRCTTMQMLVSSAHPDIAGLQIALAETLLDFGADVDGVEHDGSPLLTAFRFHYPRTAEALARRGARVEDVISAAALGRADLVDRFVADDGTIRPGGRFAAGPWPSLPRDPVIHLAYALTWAVAFGRAEVVEVLLRKGVPATAADSDAGAIHFAAAYGRIDLVRLLVKHGASLEQLNSYDGTVLDGTIWYALNGPIEGVDYAAVVRELVAMGARTDLYPEMPRYLQAVLDGQRGGGYPK